MVCGVEKALVTVNHGRVAVFDTQHQRHRLRQNLEYRILIGGQARTDIFEGPSVKRWVAAEVDRVGRICVCLRVCLCAVHGGAGMSEGSQGGKKKDPFRRVQDSLQSAAE